MKKPINLFTVNFHSSEISLNPFSILTPLGGAKIAFEINHRAISQDSCQSGIITEKSSIHIWSSDQFELEIIKTHFPPLIPPHMHVDCCIAYICRMKALCKAELTASCCLLSRLKGEPESGQGLIALTFEKANTRLTIGTEDEELLLSRAECREGLPYRFFSDKLISYRNFDYLKNGIKIHVPPLLEGEIGQIQFILSWSEIKCVDPNSTYFAVDIRPNKILEHV